MTGRRLLLVGLDAATLTLIRPWVERGDLPALGRLMQSGASGRLQSVPNMVTPAAWTSFATGCNPGKHGIFFFTERIPGSYEERLVKGGTRTGAPFWMLLGREGVRCTVVNVPMTFPADPLNGVMVSGLDAPNIDAPGFTHPPELATQLRQAFGQMPGPATLPGGIGHLMLAGELDAAREMCEQRVRLRTDLARHLMERYPCDVFALVHTEADAIQHYFWKYLHPRAVGHSSRAAQRHGDSILRVYQQVDRSIDALMTAFGPANVMVVSDHGAGASPGVDDGIPWIRLILEEMGLSVRRVEQSTWRRTTKNTMSALYRALNPRLSPGVRRLINRLVPNAKRLVRASSTYQCDWSRTRAFCMGAPGEVWLNVRGRDPEGLVEPGADYEQTRQRIREVFMALRDAQSGEALVQAVSFREELYQGPFVERAPDLYIAFRDVVLTDVLMNGKVLRLPRRAAAVPKEVKSGSHRPEGVLILAGDGIRPGVELMQARLVDIAPTVLYWMGCPVPSYMDGSVLAHAFTPAYSATHPVKVLEAGIGMEGRISSEYTSEDANAVIERLRALGYI